MSTLLSDRDLYLANLPLWAEFYVEGWWTLEQFEAHADRMREVLLPPLAPLPKSKGTR